MFNSLHHAVYYANNGGLVYSPLLFVYLFMLSQYKLDKDDVQSTYICSAFQQSSNVVLLLCIYCTDHVLAGTPWEERRDGVVVSSLYKMIVDFTFYSKLCLTCMYCTYMLSM